MEPYSDPRQKPQGTHTQTYKHTNTCLQQTGTADTQTMKRHNVASDELHAEHTHSEHKH